MQSFREIREGGYVYIDKTEDIYQMVNTGKYYFLSRPRRFGKSLLVDTIDELFSGNQKLFEGLWVHEKWDWAKTNPVIHFDFANIGLRTRGLENAIIGALEDNANRLGISLHRKEYDLMFRELIEKASLNGKVVILIDEYDKPIIDFMDDLDLLEANRSIMKSFYSVLKPSDGYIRFLLITGVSQFSKVSIFSDLNNLDNISLIPQYGGIIGITQKELEENFAEEIDDLQKSNPNILTQIKDWYDGYTWNMNTWVYNPFSLLKFMKYQIFQNFWFETGTPTFLLKQLKMHSIYNVEDIEASSQDLSSFNTDNPDPGSLLFQTGYLTIKKISSDRQLYKLGFPNKEVKSSFLGGLLSTYRNTSGGDTLQLIKKLNRSLRGFDIEGVVNQLNALTSSIAYDHWKGDTESIFHILTYLTFKLSGVDVYTEVHSATGRCDILVKTELYIYVMELKLNGTAEDALHQIKNKGYLKPYESDLRKKIAVGISFSSAQRTVNDYKTEEL
ncbi:PD-(D/E)XK nuclease superfamily protein [Arachidicoccus rhizosphaerae]|uniref:PD-(D/E)XK nuclease superfamily protein n=2 Tax=Arachidicoccus rhizosphaerae TaxID=551991 RepID=A0A1H4BGC7_9BACT|nr:PD-(D/E)XK nuclease superfamily protein [Arachidicoccus rhizosphaerae]